ncbi:MAG: hypothetical protein AAFQ64_20050 [Pseudomonadota bacterium]
MKYLAAIPLVLVAAACSQPQPICNQDVYDSEKAERIPGPICPEPPQSTSLFGPFQGIAKDRSDRRDAFFSRNSNVLEEQVLSSSGGDVGTPIGDSPGEDGADSPTTDPQPTDPNDPQPTDPSDPQPTDPNDPQPTDPSDPQPTDPSDPQPTDPNEPQPTDPNEPQDAEYEYSDGYSNPDIWSPEKIAADIARRQSAGLPTRRESLCRAGERANSERILRVYGCDRDR